MSEISSKKDMPEFSDFLRDLSIELKSESIEDLRQKILVFERIDEVFSSLIEDFGVSIYRGESVVEEYKMSRKGEIPSEHIPNIVQPGDIPVEDIHEKRIRFFGLLRFIRDLLGHEISIGEFLSNPDRDFPKDIDIKPKEEIELYSLSGLKIFESELKEFLGIEYPEHPPAIVIEWYGLDGLTPRSVHNLALENNLLPSRMHNGYKYLM